MKSVPGAIATGSKPSIRARWLSANPVAIAPGTDCIMLSRAAVEGGDETAARWLLCKDDRPAGSIKKCQALLTKYHREQCHYA